jgi:hypothetical protein
MLSQLAAYRPSMCGSALAGQATGGMSGMHAPLATPDGSGDAPNHLAVGIRFAAFRDEESPRRGRP